MLAGIVLVVSGFELQFDFIFICVCVCLISKFSCQLSQISEVVSSMKDLINFCWEQKVGPIGIFWKIAVHIIILRITILIIAHLRAGLCVLYCLLC